MDYDWIIFFFVPIVIFCLFFSVGSERKPFEWWIWSDKWFHCHLFDKRILFVIIIFIVAVDIVIVSVTVANVIRSISMNLNFAMKIDTVRWINTISIQYIDIIVVLFWLISQSNQIKSIYCAQTLIHTHARCSDKWYT